MSEKFLSRWSRRKRAASIPPPASEASSGEGGDPGLGLGEPGGGNAPDSKQVETARHPDPLPATGEREIARGKGDASAFDPASLPPLESIDAGTDVSAYLRPGVPADLANAALRRAWVADPAIRDFVGLAENSWDFNAPGGVPGFEPLRAVDDVQRLAAQVLGAFPAAAKPSSPDAQAPIADPAAASEEQPAGDVASTDAAAPPLDAAAQKSPPPETSPSVRLRHGGALPE